MTTIEAAIEWTHVFIRELDEAIARAGEGLEESVTNPLRASTVRTRLALEHLAALLQAENPSLYNAPSIAFGSVAPLLPRDRAEALLNALSGLVSGIEHRILVPLEELLVDESAVAAVRKQVGQTWGWMFCDIQDPLLQQHPELQKLS